MILIKVYYMLYLIGLGLDSGDLPIKAVELLRKADSILYEGYTASITQEFVDVLVELLLPLTQ